MNKVSATLILMDRLKMLTYECDEAEALRVTIRRSLGLTTWDDVIELTNGWYAARRASRELGDEISGRTFEAFK